MEPNKPNYWVFINLSWPSRETPSIIWPGYVSSQITVKETRGKISCFPLPELIWLNLTTPKGKDIKNIRRIQTLVWLREFAGLRWSFVFKSTFSHMDLWIWAEVSYFSPRRSHNWHNRNVCEKRCNSRQIVKYLKCGIWKWCLKSNYLW